MSHMTTESDDDMLFGDHSGSPLTDEGKSGGSAGGSTVLKKGPWTSVEDAILVDYVHKHGEGNWNAVQKHSRLSRCGKSCRLRWANHLRPNLKKGAFTPEEERLIIELHAKMGNKWARMAAHLPGRTDNEIKNYWNTRIKRRQRAGLPLYPSEVCLRQMQESQLNQNTDGGGQNDHLQSSSFEIPEVLFDCLKDTQGVLSYIPEIPCISTSAMRMNTLNSSEYYGFVPPIVHHSKRPRETATSIFAYGSSVRNHPPQFERQPLDDSCGNVPSQTFGSSFTYDPDPTTKNQLPFGINQGFHSLINGKFSASKPSSGASKLELPSLQYPETDFSSWGSSSPPTMCESVDAFIQSPARSGALHFDCPSPKNSGLLDALLHESKTLSSKNQQLSQKSQNSSALVPDDTANCSMLDVSKAKWEEYGDSISPLGNSETSIFSNCTPLSGTGSPLKENPPAETWPGSKIETEAGRQVWPMDKEKKENGAKLDYLRPDSLLGSCFFRRSFAYEKEQGPKSEYAPPSTHDDLGNDHKLQMGSSAPNQGWGFGSCQWNNMPAVCQISEFT